MFFGLIGSLCSMMCVCGCDVFHFHSQARSRSSRCTCCLASTKTLFYVLLHLHAYNPHMCVTVQFMCVRVEPPCTGCVQSSVSVEMFRRIALLCPCHEFPFPSHTQTLLCPRYVIPSFASAHSNTHMLWAFLNPRDGPGYHCEMRV